MAGGLGVAGATAADGGAGTDEVEGAPVRNFGNDGELGSWGIFGSAASFGIRPGALKPPSGGIFGSLGICGIAGSGGLATFITGAAGIVNCFPTTGIPSIIALPRSCVCGGGGAGGANPDDAGGIAGGCRGAIGITVAVCAVWSNVTICCAWGSVMTLLVPWSWRVMPFEERKKPPGISCGCRGAGDAAGGVGAAGGAPGAAGAGGCGGAGLRTVVIDEALNGGSENFGSIAMKMTSPLLEITSQCLLALNGLKQRLKVALAEAAAALALDNLVKQRWPVFDRAGEDLQHVAFVVAID